MWNTPSLLLLPGPLRPGVIVPVRVSSMCQIEPFNRFIYSRSLNCVRTNDCYVELIVLHINA